MSGSVGGTRDPQGALGVPAGKVRLTEYHPAWPNEFELERARLMQALVDQNLWRWQPADGLPSYSPALARAVHAFLGLSTASFAMLQIEDLIGMVDPVNVPGTYNEHANWQRKVTMDTRDIFDRADVRDMLDAMNRSRRGENPNVQ